VALVALMVVAVVVATAVVVAVVAQYELFGQALLV
jgi:hypothetical protein